MSLRDPSSFFNGPEFYLDSSACGAFFELSIPICPFSPRAAVPLQVATRLVAAFRPSIIANSPLFALRIVRAPRPGTLAAVYEDWARPALVPSSPARSRTILVQSINWSPLASVFYHSTKTNSSWKRLIDELFLLPSIRGGLLHRNDSSPFKKNCFRNRITK